MPHVPLTPAATLRPPLLLCPQVLMQLLCTRADPAFSAEPDEQGELQQPLTSAAVASVAEELLSNADVEYLQDDEQLQNRCALPHAHMYMCCRSIVLGVGRTHTHMWESSKQNRASLALFPSGFCAGCASLIGMSSLIAALFE